MPPWSLSSSDAIVKRRRKLGTGTRPSTSLGPVKPYPPKRLEKQSLYYVAGSNRGLNTGDDASTDKEVCRTSGSIRCTPGIPQYTPQQSV
jgi:hypothetical protein